MKCEQQSVIHIDILIFKGSFTSAVIYVRRWFKFIATYRKNEYFMEYLDLYLKNSNDGRLGS